MPVVPRRLQRLRRATGRLVRLGGRPPFPTPLLVHCSYHKCLTVFVGGVFAALAHEFGFAYRHFNSDVEDFVMAARNVRAPTLLSVNNRSDINWSDLPAYRGSHFVRDPRDLAVSGYHYHLWTEEAWCRDDRFDWSRITGHPGYARIADRMPRPLTGTSFQTALKSLGRDDGLFLEILRLSPTFEQMGAWDYDNPHVLEMRYEDIVGNEESAFDRLLRHYQVHEAIRARGIALASQLSLNSLVAAGSTGAHRHVRSGLPEQWRSELPDDLGEMFAVTYGRLLAKLGYPLQ